MTLSSLIRKRDTGNIATAMPAISATQPRKWPRTVAKIAGIAVASQTTPRVKVLAGDTADASRCPMTTDEEKAIRAWLALIEETDPATIADVLNQCRRDADARGYFTGRAASELPKPDPFPDDRRFCTQCQSLKGSVCGIAGPGMLVSARQGYQPVRDVPHRCAGYQPNS